MPRAVRLGRAPLRPSDSHALGKLSAGTEIAALVTLKPQNGLATYAQAVTTPGSGLYHHYLSVRQFREQFGASRATIDTVTNSLRARGLTPGQVSANGLSIAVDASASKLSSAFKTSFERVRLPSGRVAFANTSAPELSATVSPHVQAILGLNSLNPRSTDLVRGHGVHTSTSRPRPHISASGGPTNSCLADGTNGSYWNADQIAQAYGFNGYYSVGNEGAGQTIALLELEPNLTSDISVYAACYGVAPTINYNEVDGGAGSGAGSGEAALDIEQVIGLAPQATVDVYQAPNNGNSGFVAALQAMVDNSAVNVISDSWGACETLGQADTSGSTENVLFEQAATEGKSVYAASGDTGSSGCYDSNQSNAPAVSDPASQIYVTGTGATSLPGVGTTPEPASQSVWNDSEGSGGGGVSSIWPMPSWQSEAVSALNVIGANSSGAACRAAGGSYCREVPDVSADGDPETGYAIYYNGGGMVVGGTSAVAPLWAAYTALVNDSSVCNKTAIGFANPLLYEAADDSYASDFTDIAAAGNNDLTSTGYVGGLYPVGTGYDMATGLGAPIGATLGNTLCDEADAVTLSEPPAQTTTVGAGVNLPLTASDSEGHAVGSFSAAGLPPGLSINPTTGAVTGVPAQAGRYNVAVTATASLSGAHTTKSFSWLVVALATTRKMTFKLDNQTLTLTTPIAQTCMSPSVAYKVRFTTSALARTSKGKLTFKAAAFYLDRGVKRLRTKSKPVDGHKRTVKVTTYAPNATTRGASGSVSLSLRGLSTGTHIFKLVLAYTERSVSRGKTKTTMKKKTIAVRFKVC